MKRYNLLLFFACLSIAFAGYGQNIPENLLKRNEIYFTFQVKTLAEINTITNLISIDNVKGKQVWAYANVKQFLEFRKLGYDITLMPVQDNAQGIVMKDHVVLSPLTTWNFYPTYTAYESLMVQFQTMYPAICHLDTIATLASGRRLLSLKISDNVATDETEPEFLYSSSIHGDEITGYVLMLHLADYLLSNYGTNPEATDLVNNMEIFICPLANPDGTYTIGNTITSPTRGNANGVDMNRNYPDPQDGPHPDGQVWQPETVAFMDFASQHHFVAGANFHGGIEVVNYPWDTWPTLHADDNWYQYISRQYVDTVHLHSPATYMDDLVNGITNGYAWYEVDGGRQDYMNYFHHCREITIEISTIKAIPASQLETYWNYNWRSFIRFLKETRFGIHGIITDQITGSPVAAKVFITGHDNNGSEVYSSANLGDYHRPVKAGTYTLEITAPCYQTQTITGVSVSDQSILTLNIQMVPGPSAAVVSSSVSAISSSGAVSGGNVTCTGSTPVTERGVCWSTSANPVVSGNHTTNGSGTGAFISQISGLSANTVYHVRAYATNASGTSYGADIQFTTLCGVLTTFPWNEGFENGGAIPNCWTQEQVNSSGIYWTFITGNGGSNPSTAHGGTKNACLKDGSASDNKTKLISPSLNLTSVPSPQLKFWHTQAVWSGDQDQLTVFIKSTPGGVWTPVATYIASITAWTQETILLPNPSGEYSIAFEGNAKWGYGVCIDDVQVSSACTTIYPVSVSVVASANPVNSGTLVTFTASPVNGGVAPGYQWQVNGGNVGTNSPEHTYVPVNGDVVTCILTSNATCVTGNPAMSNSVTMIVNGIPSTLELQNLSVSDVQCFNAIQTITVAGNGTTLTVTNAGSATMIAGQNIIYLPGTTVDSGGYMNGYISSNGQYCNVPAISVLTGEGEFTGSVMQQGLKIYPNPTKGAFSLEVPMELPENSFFEIYSMGGQKILWKEFSGSKSFNISLENYPSGIYLVRVFGGKQNYTARIVRQD
jgi:hypothetical protein